MKTLRERSREREARVKKINNNTKNSRSSFHSSNKKKKHQNNNNNNNNRLDRRPRDLRRPRPRPRLARRLGPAPGTLLLFLEAPAGLVAARARHRPQRRHRRGAAAVLWSGRVGADGARRRRDRRHARARVAGGVAHRGEGRGQRGGARRVRASFFSRFFFYFFFFEIERGKKTH